MNKNSMGNQYTLHDVQKVKKSYCNRAKVEQHQLFHIQGQSDSKIQFNKELKSSMLSFQRNSMIHPGSAYRIPTFILNKHKNNPLNQSVLSLAAFGREVQDDPFCNQKNPVNKYSRRNQHRVINGRVYASQIYTPNPEKNNHLLVTAEKKCFKMFQQTNGEKRLESHGSMKSFKKHKPYIQSAKIQQKESLLNIIQDRRATVSSVSSSNSSKSENKKKIQKELFNESSNHIPLFIKNKHKKHEVWPFTISPKNQTAIKNMKKFHDLGKKKPLRNLKIDNYYQFEDKISIESKKQLQISDFQLCQKIGKGAYGDVFLAKEIHLGFLCVIKKISKKKIHDQNLYESILREIKIQSYVDHKHLVPIYGVFDDQAYVYIILEYMIDGTLSYEIKKHKKMSQALTVFYLKQLCEAISYMHNENIIHRDIKPDNIFMHDNYLKLGDLGCSVQTQTLRNTIVGCLAYVSPEQLGKKFYDQKIDIWSIGILTYQMLFGRPPFQKQLMQMANQHLQMQVLPDLQFPVDHKISIEAHNFIENLLSKDPDQRMCVKQALKHAFITKYHSQQIFNYPEITVKMHQLLNK